MWVNINNNCSGEQCLLPGSAQRSSCTALHTERLWKSCQDSSKDGVEPPPSKRHGVFVACATSAWRTSTICAQRRWWGCKNVAAERSHAVYLTPWPSMRTMSNIFVSYLVVFTEMALRMMKYPLRLSSSNTTIHYNHMHVLGCGKNWGSIWMYITLYRNSHLKGFCVKKRCQTGTPNMSWIPLHYYLNVPFSNTKYDEI